MLVPTPAATFGAHSTGSRLSSRGPALTSGILDMTGTEALYDNEPLDTTARRIRAGVLEATGMKVSIGGGTTKLIAKLAVEHGKPSRNASADGVFIVPEGGEAAFMRTVALAEIPGIGPKQQAKSSRAPGW